MDKKRAKKYLTRKEELILLVVFRLGEAANLVRIREELEKITGLNWSVGNVYVPLDRLHRLGFLDTRVGAPSSRRGGKAVKYYLISADGKQALRELKRVYESLWEGLPDLAPER